MREKKRTLGKLYQNIIGPQYPKISPERLFFNLAQCLKNLDCYPKWVKNKTFCSLSPGNVFFAFFRMLHVKLLAYDELCVINYILLNIHGTKCSTVHNQAGWWFIDQAHIPRVYSCLAIPGGEDSSGSGGGLQELGSLEYIIQSWAHDIFIASRQRQRDNVIDPQGPEKILKGLGVEQSQKQIL